MPTTEVPNSPPPVQDPKPDYELEPRNNSSYGDLGTDELVQRINELEDERRAARIREGIWVALLLHAVAVLLWIYGPRYILHEPVVVRPAVKNQDFTYFNMPPDALRHLHPKSPAPVHPSVDRKTLEHYQAQRKATPAPQQPAAPQKTTPPPPTPQPVQQAQQQPPPPLPQSQAQEPSPTPQPAPKQQSQAAPQEAQPAPNPFKTNDSAGDMIRQAAKGAAGGSSEVGTNAPPGAGGMGAGASILSDTMGVNFKPWLDRVVAATYRAWLPIIPLSAKPPLNDKGRVSIKFDVLPDGTVKHMSLMSGSGEVPLDRAAWAGITGATYPPLPADFKGKSITLGFGFYYNIPVDQK